MANEELLGNVALFSACSGRELRRIAAKATDRRVPAGAVLVREGDSADRFLVIAEGLASVTVGDREVATAGPGTTVGETALLDGGTRSATVTALLPMRVLEFDRAALDDLVDHVPAVAKRLLVQSAKRLRAADVLATA